MTTFIETGTMEFSETRLTELLANGDEQVFEQVFKSNFKSLHVYAATILKNESAAEEMVQQVFYKIWEQREKLNIQSSLKAYLYRSVHNVCINHLTHQKVRATHQSYTMQHINQQEEGDTAARKVQQGELEKNIRKALNELPEQCRTIFQMSRFEELKYHEIATQLGISVKTVENQMGKALRLMRIKLVEFLPFIIVLLHL